MDKFTSFKRVETSLNHREPDRVPFDLGGALVAGINVVALNNLRRYLGLEGKAEVWDTITQLGEIDDDIIDGLDIDIINVSPNPPVKPGLSKQLKVKDGYHGLIDEFGIEYRMPAEGGHYYDIYKSPLRNADTVADIKKYPWPDPTDKARFEGLRQKADRVVHNGKAYFLERMSAGMWENAMWMRGYEQFFMDMLSNKNGTCTYGQVSGNKNGVLETGAGGSWRECSGGIHR
ncbi:MAG: hypothetical protein U5N58_09120 [Actinomycetota bacterium]|nr:hypothetical protein [Actinomycetota bacterium]